MTQEEILEYNKRCAEFLGYKECLVNITDNYGYKVVVEGYITPFPKLNFDGTIYQYDVDSLIFHSDWNWIMEVVEAISKIVDTRDGTKWGVKPFSIGIVDNMATLNIHPQYEMVYFENGEDAPFDYIELPTKKEAVVQAINQFLIWYDTRIS